MRSVLAALAILFCLPAAAVEAGMPVNKDAAVADARRFLAKVPVTFVLVQDGADAAARGFDVKAMPSGYLVDRKGVVRHVHRGFTAETGAALEKEIDSLLEEPS